MYTFFALKKLITLIAFTSIALLMSCSSYAQTAMKSPGVAHAFPFDANQGAIDFLTEPFPVSNVERNKDNLPIYLIECNHHDQCVGPQGEAIGSAEEVAHDMPTLPKSLLVGHGYTCHDVCYDAGDHIVGSNPLVYGK